MLPKQRVPQTTRSPKDAFPKRPFPSKKSPSFFLLFYHHYFFICRYLGMEDYNPYSYPDALPEYIASNEVPIVVQSIGEPEPTTRASSSSK